MGKSVEKKVLRYLMDRARQIVVMLGIETMMSS